MTNAPLAPRVLAVAQLLAGGARGGSQKPVTLTASQSVAALPVPRRRTRAVTESLRSGPDSNGARSADDVGRRRQRIALH